MNNKLIIAAAQHPVSGDIQQNLVFIHELMDEASNAGADIIHFSECNLSAYGGIHFEQYPLNQQEEITKSNKMNNQIINTTLILLFFLSLGASPKAISQVTQDAELAFNSSLSTNHPVLLFFSGSDWCPYCIRFEKDILSTSQFQSFAANNLVILQADFPQRIKQEADVISQNEQLADKYNPKGEFPTLLLIYPQTDSIDFLEYEQQDYSTFIDLVRKKIKSRQSGE